MGELVFTDEQLAVTTLPLDGRTFLEGPPGSGKTTASVYRLLSMLEEGVQAENILLLVPQRTLAHPYNHALRQPDLPAVGQVSILTLGGLAQRSIQLFWPLISRQAGFRRPDSPPVFLTLETAQYYLARIVRPLQEAGYFQSISIDPNRLLSQILDNLNKAAAVGFDASTIADRLMAASIGKPEELHAYHEAQECANRFRAFCFEHNLLDFSLQLEVFTRYLWGTEICHNYLSKQYRHLIYDNVEEDIPIAHDIIHSWLPELDSALLIYDSDGGYRLFLGADPESGASLNIDCERHIVFINSLVNSYPIQSFQETLESAIKHEPIPTPKEITQAASTLYNRFATQTMDALAGHISRLVHDEGVSPSEIVVLSPFMSDSLRFSLMNRLENLQIPSYSHRPSRALRDEPATQCLLTLAKLAHPSWKLPCTQQDIRSMLVQSISGLDPLRADLLSKITYRPAHWMNGLGSFDAIRPETQDRITFTIGERFEILRTWLNNYQSTAPTELDIFLSRLFGELLSQRGFGFHEAMDNAAVAARLIESIRKFRWVLDSSFDDIRNSKDRSHNEGFNLGAEYINMVTNGILAAQYLQGWDSPSGDAVLLAPAYTFLMMNYPVRYQFWLDIGGLGWYARLSQPLTHPYVLSRHWPAQGIWTDAHEQQTSTENLNRLTRGLLRRCREHVYLYVNGINEQGDEQRGPLLYALQAILRQQQGNENV